MRISDWSSDVCSSDLDEAQIDAFEQPVASQAVEFGGSEPEPRHTAIDLKHRGERPSGGPGKTGPAMHLFERIEEGNGAGVEAGRLQIGRASCRERVCQYV